MKPFQPVRHVPAYSRMLLDAIFEPVVVFIVLAGNAVLFASAFFFQYFEKGNNPSVRGFSDALWWGLSTVTTVGYGDIVPHTDGGKLVGAGLMLLGIFFFVAFTAAVASILVARTTAEAEKVTYAEYRKLADAIHKIEQRLEAIEERLPSNRVSK